MSISRVEDYLIENARRFGDKVALVADGLRLSYFELDRLSDHIATELRRGGVQRGDRVLVFMDNCWEAAVSIFAVLKAGAVFSPINPSTKADKLALLTGNCRPAAIITQASLLDVAGDALRSCPSLAIRMVATRGKGDLPHGWVSFEDVLTAPCDPPSRDGINLDLAMLVYTSGSTGFPKGVMVTHQNIDAAATSVITYLENTDEDVILGVLPISFNYGLYQLLMAIKLGATLVLEKSFAFPQAILNRIREERVTGFPLVPTMAALLLQMKDLHPGQYPTLRYITSAGAALPPAHIARLQDLFPTTTIFSMYGLTECKRCTYLPPVELKRRPGSVGIAIPGTEAFVVDEQGNRLPLGSTGELVIRGAHVMKGYWEDPEATQRALRPGILPQEMVLYTGDLFRTDEEGFLYFVGRKDDIIKTRGQKVSPKEVENVLYALAGVREAAVVGVPDPVLGHAIKAVIALEARGAVTAADVIRHCARNLEDFMVPKIVEFRDQLPKSENGKIARRQVEAEATEAVQ
jgi:amino acid adenylation domain-containing protein